MGWFDWIYEPEEEEIEVREEPEPEITPPVDDVLLQALRL